MRFFQSLDMFKKKKNSMEDTVDIRDILEAGGHGLVMTQRFPTGKGEKLIDNFCWRSQSILN